MAADVLLSDDGVFQLWQHTDSLGNVSTYEVTWAQLNHDNLVQQAQTALANNRTYLNIGNPNNAQVTAQVAALTHQIQALIRFALSQFDGTN